MQCDFCHKEFTESGYVWLNNQWCVISHVEPQAGAGLPHICNKCAISLSKKEIIQELNFLRPPRGKELQPNCMPRKAHIDLCGVASALLIRGSGGPRYMTDNLEKELN